MKRTITILADEDYGWQILDAGIPADEFHAALGYLSAWGLGSDLYSNLVIGIQPANPVQLTASYSDAAGVQRFYLVAVFDAATKTFSFHS